MQDIYTDSKKSNRLVAALVGQEYSDSQYGQTYFAYLQTQSRTLDQTQFEPLFNSSQLSQAQFSEKIMDVIISVANWIREEARPNTTMEDIVKSVISPDRSKGSAGLSSEAVPLSSRLSPEKLEIGLQAIFASIGWLSLIYVPSQMVTKGQFSIRESRSKSVIRHEQSTACANKSFCNMSLGFGHLLPSLNIGSAVATDNTLLYTSTLNFSALKDLGKVSIYWTLEIGSHLDFDPIRRKLTLFRLPSFCALCLTSPQQLRLFEKCVLCPRF